MRTLTGSLLALVAGLTLAACGGSTDEAAPPTTPELTETQPIGQNREKAPAIDGLSLDGESIALGDFRGRPVLVNIWSSW